MLNLPDVVYTTTQYTWVPYVQITLESPKIDFTETGRLAQKLIIYVFKNIYTVHPGLT